MRLLCRAFVLIVALVLGCAPWCRVAIAQDSPGDSAPDGFAPGGFDQGRSSQGAASGTGDNGPDPGRANSGFLGGRPGASRPRVPSSSPSQSGIRPAPRMNAPAPPKRQPARIARLPHAWATLFEIEDQGPPHGLTLEQAIDRVIRESLSLRGKALEIPQAQADVLTAGLRANPVVAFDSQLIPYRPYSAATNPGGPTQYDLNVTYPIDLTGKRQARVGVACAAERVVEAQYQDAIRLEIDRLYSAYVDTLATRQSVRSARANLTRIDQFLSDPENRPADAHEAESRQRQLQIQRHTAALALLDAESTLANNQRTLATILSLPRQQAQRLELRGTIQDDAPPPPGARELVAMALANRPDLAAFRLGLGRAQADVRLTLANRMPDVFVLYQPFTYQDGTPFTQPSSTSFAIGATATVPLFDRNQGNIQRARINVDQTTLELRTQEQKIIDDVEQAQQEYATTREAVGRIERELLPMAREVMEENTKQFREKQLDAAGYLSAQRDFDDLGRQYREMLIRHRRSMLDLNTAVGRRILP